MAYERAVALHVEGEVCGFGEFAELARRTDFDEESIIWVAAIDGALLLSLMIGSSPLSVQDPTRPGWSMTELALSDHVGTVDPESTPELVREYLQEVLATKTVEEVMAYTASAGVGRAAEFVHESIHLVADLICRKAVAEWNYPKGIYDESVGLPGPSDDEPGRWN